MNLVRPIILGCEGFALSPEERKLFKRLNPFGFILFARNCRDPEQLCTLTSALRDTLGRQDIPIFIDQEGGRVARLKPPHWPALPAARTLGLLYERDQEAGREALALHCRITASMLRAVGINGNCTPVLDLMIDGATSAIGDRAFSASPSIVSALGEASVQTYLAHGVYPVIKHIPGHGRAMVDPHFDLPVVETAREVLEAQDFEPFRALCHAPMAMNCHVLYRDLDARLPASLSPTVQKEIIRGVIGFDGLLLTDDLAMGALKIPVQDRVTQALAAGADLALYCTGSVDTAQMLEGLELNLSVKTQERWRRARELCNADAPCEPIDSLVEAFRQITDRF